MNESWPLALGTARALGFFAQMEGEASHPSIPTLVEPPAAWKAVLDKTYDERECELRLRRAQREFRRAGKAMRKWWTPERRAAASLRLKAQL